MKVKLYLLFSLYSITSFWAQNLDSLESMYYSSYNTVKQQLKEVDKTYPVFTIEGVIKDRDPKSVLLFGHAFPVNKDYNLLGTVYEGHIQIINYKESGLSAGIIYSGKHRFTEKIYGKNGFGAEVPIYVYGNVIKEVQSVIDKLERDITDLSIKLAEIKTRKLNRKVNTLIGEAIYFYEAKDYSSSAFKLEAALFIDPNNAKAKERLFLCYNNLANENINNISVSSSFAYKAKKIGIVNIELEEVLGKTFLSIANNLFASNSFEEASGYYNEAYSFISSFPKNELENYANCEINLGEADLSVDKISEGMIHLNNAFSLTPSKKIL